MSRVCFIHISQFGTSHETHSVTDMYIKILNLVTESGDQEVVFRGCASTEFKKHFCEGVSISGIGKTSKCYCGKKYCNTGSKLEKLGLHFNMLIISVMLTFLQ